MEAERSGSGVENEAQQKLGKMVFHWGEVNTQTVVRLFQNDDWKYSSLHFPLYT